MSTVTSAATRRPYDSPGRLGSRVLRANQSPWDCDLSAFICVHPRFALCEPVNRYPLSECQDPHRNPYDTPIPCRYIYR